MEYDLSGIDEWQIRIKTFVKEKLPDATTDTVIAHLKDEIKELEETGDPKEIADCMFLLIHYAIITDCRLSHAMRDKFKIIKNREYQSVKNEQGYFKSKKGE